MENENKLDEMIDILSKFQGYVPMQKLSANLKVPGKGETDKVTVERIHQLLKELRGSGRTYSMPWDVWRDLFPYMVEDWHAKVCL